MLSRARDMDFHVIICFKCCSIVTISILWHHCFSQTELYFLWESYLLYASAESTGPVQNHSICWLKWSTVVLFLIWWYICTLSLVESMCVLYVNDNSITLHIRKTSSILNWVQLETNNVSTKYWCYFFACYIWQNSWDR